jgi:hypothetical protein
VVSIGGREIKAESHDSMKYGLLITNAAAQYIQSVTAGSMAVNGKATNPAMVMAIVKFATDILNHLAQLMEKLVDVVRTWIKFIKMDAGVRKEKIAQEAKEKAENEKKKVIEAYDKERAAKRTLNTATAEADARKSDYDAKRQGYNYAMQNGTDTEKQEARAAMEQAYKDMRMAEDKQKESEESYKSSQKDTEIAYGVWNRAYSTLVEGKKAAVSKWNTEVTKAIKRDASKTTTPPSPPPSPSPPSPPPPSGTGTTPPGTGTLPVPPLPSPNTKWVPPPGTGGSTPP